MCNDETIWKRDALCSLDLPGGGGGGRYWSNLRERYVGARVASPKTNMVGPTCAVYGPEVYAVICFFVFFGSTVTHCLPSRPQSLIWYLQMGFKVSK